MKIEFAVLELACSRFCHDLISPIGAVNNGLELLEDERDPALVAEARALAARSARRASILLQAFRCAFGNAGNQPSFGFGESIRLARDYLDGGKVTLGGVPAVSPGDLPAGFGKLLLQAIMLMSETLPRGGELMLRVDREGAAAGFRLAAEGPQIVIAEEVGRLVSGTPDVTGLDARNVVACLIGLTAGRLGMKVEIGRSAPGRLEFMATPPVA